MRPALEGLCYLTDLACEGGDDVLGRELARWAADVHAATLAVRAGQPDAARQLRASALARVAQISAVGSRLSAVDAYHAASLPPVVLLHTAVRALAAGDALAAAAACREAIDVLEGGDAMPLPALPAHSPCDSSSECMECGARDCPHGEPLHYHHDGCPACCLSEAAHTDVEVDLHGVVRRLPGDAS